MIAIIVRHNIGLGDALQFTSVPENYYRHTGEKLIDWESHPVFDYNPYVIRGQETMPDKSIDLWSSHCLDVPVSFNNRTTYLSNAEVHSRHLGGYPIVLNRPRLYRYENAMQVQASRRMVLLHVKGKSHGQMPEHVVKHVLKKYNPWVARIGLDDEWIYPMPEPYHYKTKDLWEMAEVISEARIFIGVDSGPSWIARCYPDVVTKIVRLIPSVEALKDWVPLECCRLGSHFDDRSALIHNVSEDDAGITWSYRRL